MVQRRHEDRSAVGVEDVPALRGFAAQAIAPSSSRQRPAPTATHVSGSATSGPVAPSQPEASVESRAGGRHPREHDAVLTDVGRELGGLLERVPDGVDDPTDRLCERLRTSLALTVAVLSPPERRSRPFTSVSSSATSRRGPDLDLQLLGAPHRPPGHALVSCARPVRHPSRSHRCEQISRRPCFRAK
jgi:hypothetical protein